MTTDDTGGVTAAEQAARRKEWEDAWTLLSSVRSTLADLLEAARYETGVPREISKKISDLESALKAAFEVERRFNDWLKRQDGGLAAGEIDLDDARRRITCRLDRLRACCREDRLS
ncbi:hypothetical protein T8T21_02780 [Limimaricola variabilis]|uniref:hypothetical protein n=1 Tax=Limimaricola variabilis TaxID=1492771 RepID=UPI002AC93FB1|nr:hypothetical protein [Limimaricola variabilis]WPY95067.1 hypothetical protein T8T21_02780 [Limimaricola variabilis]